MKLETPIVTQILTRLDQEAEDLTFLPRALVMANLPHSEKSELIWKRTAGHFTLTVRAHPDYGLPFGSYPRLFAMWLTNEIKRTKSPVVEFNRSYRAFLLALRIETDGKTRARFQGQVVRLLTSCISLDKKTEERFDHAMMPVADKFSLWWNPVSPTEELHTRIEVSKSFYDNIERYAVPLDIRAINALKRSPMRLDIYSWLTYRMSYLKRPTHIPWTALFNQFGSDYESIYHFINAFTVSLKYVSLVYSQARVEIKNDGLCLRPSPSHVLKRQERLELTP